MNKLFAVKVNFILFVILIPMFLITGCAMLQKKTTDRHSALSEMLSKQTDQVKSHVRIFPDFIAVIALPGDTFSSLAAQYLNDPGLDWFISEFNDLTSLRPGQELIIPLNDYEKGGVTLRGYQTVPVLSYHKFARNNSDTMTVSEKSFEEQMRFLKKNGYHVITLDEFFDFRNFRKQLPGKSVVITIDDGWRSTYDIAFPILKKYGYPATLFIYTDFIFKTRNTLDWTQLAEMSNNGIDIQSHTKSHRNLNRWDEKESFREYFDTVRKELTESAHIIKKRLNKDVTYLAYPYGDTNPLIIALLAKLGYKGAFTVNRGSNPFYADNFRINRSMIYGNFSLKDFERNLTTFSSDELN